MSEMVSKILNQFDPITLAEMEGVKLMDRTDTKFTFNISYFESVLLEAKKHYRVVEIEGNRICRYKTLYFDTPDFSLYNQHHSGKLNRYKIRHRTYVESNIGFLEVKFKSNKGRTVKNRIKEIGIPNINSGKAYEFLSNILPFDPSLLSPKLWINYSRITLVNKTSAERLTLDLYLEFQKDEEVQQLNQLVIAEVKRDSKTTSPFITILKNNHISQGSISKYCFGVASTFSEVKKNNFKLKLLNVNKIIKL